MYYTESVLKGRKKPIINTKTDIIIFNTKINTFPFFFFTSSHKTNVLQMLTNLLDIHVCDTFIPFSFWHPLNVYVQTRQASSG